jgi:mutator protein MutT
MAQTARAIIFNDEGKILMVERHKDGEHYFVLPGGHVDDGEVPERAATREVMEETGLTVTVDKLLYTSTTDKYGNDQRIFLCTYLGGEPKLQDNSVEAKAMNEGEPQQWAPAWFSFDELRDKTVYPAGLLKYLEEDKASGYHHNPYKIIERRV